MTRTWLIIAGDFTRTGGMDRANYQFAWHLADTLGHTVHLVAFQVAEPLASHDNVRVHPVRRLFGRHLLGEFLLDRTGRQLARRLTNEDPSVRVVVNGGNCAWPDVNWVHMVHHAYPCRDADAPWHFRLRNRLTRWRNRRGEKRALHASRLVIANSQKTRQDLIEHLGIEPGRVEVAYLGVDAVEFGPISVEEKAQARAHWGVDGMSPILVFIGALGYDHNKGFQTLLDACRRLRECGGVLPMVLAAGTGALGYWQAKIDARGLTGNVRLLGQVSEVARLLAAADLLVSPAHYDAYGLAVHESLCRGVPALASTATGIAERYPAELSELLLRDPNDAAELVTRIQNWHARSSELQQAVDRFGTSLRAHTWSEMSARMIALIDAAAPVTEDVHPGQLAGGKRARADAS